MRTPAETASGAPASAGLRTLLVVLVLGAAAVAILARTASDGRGPGSPPAPPSSAIAPGGAPPAPARPGSVLARVDLPLSIEVDRIRLDPLAERLVVSTSLPGMLETIVMDASHRFLDTLDFLTGVDYDTGAHRLYGGNLHDRIVVALGSARSNVLWRKNVAPFLPTDLHVCKKGGKLFVACQGGNGDDPIFVLDLETGEPFGLPIREHAVWGRIVLDEAADRLYAGADEGKRLLVLSTVPPFEVVQTVASVSPLFVDEERHRLVCSSPGAGVERRFAVFDTKTGEVRQTSVALSGNVVAHDASANRIYVGDRSRADLVVLDGETFEERSRIGLEGFSAWGMTVDRASRKLYAVAALERRRALFEIALEPGK